MTHIAPNGARSSFLVCGYKQFAPIGANSSNSRTPLHFFIKSSTSEVIALTPVLSVGSGFGGANELE